MRVLASLAFAVWFYDATGRITQALGTSTRDGALRAIDEAIFGQTSAVFCERFSDCLFTGFAIGFAGYLLVPAVGLARAYDELFTRPLPSGALSWRRRRLSAALSLPPAWQARCPSFEGRAASRPRDC